MMTPADLKNQIEYHINFSLGKDTIHASTYDWRMAVSLVVRDQIIEPWFASTRKTYERQAKRVYYLSVEFLIGRLLEDAMNNLGLREGIEEALANTGVTLEELIEDEPDAALGNGGLGRLAACFMDSLATVGCAAYGYGIRYEHGIFQQRFEQGQQIETAESWLNQQHPWEFERPEVAYEIGFGGHVEKQGEQRRWRPQEHVMASCYDTPIIGWQGQWANTLRLWSAKPVVGFDLQQFNQGDYTAAAFPETLARTITRVLYPDDTTPQGKALRLKQEYFFTAASIRDILRRFLSEYDDLRALPSKVAIQLNDTHPAIAGPELIRILMDEYEFELEAAIQITQGTLAYTNHTLLPEALERWSIHLLSSVLPRHIEIIKMVDQWHKAKFPEHADRVSLLDHGEVQMGPLAFILAHKVNGVSALHTDLIKTSVFEDLHAIYPDRIINQTNGVTPRRWIHSANPELAKLITETIGDGWLSDLTQLSQVEPHIEDAAFIERYQQVKIHNKEKLSEWLAAQSDVRLNPEALFDVQIKRIHEYKRQLLNILEAIGYWHEIRQNPEANWTPRVKIFAGKAAPGYAVAKEIIHLINDVAAHVNQDPITKDYLQIVYPANYNVSMAEMLIPAADLSEQISTAGKEASGTGNMKFALNGALTIGTLDGANVEIRERVGADNFFLFGMQAHEVEERRKNIAHAKEAIESSQLLQDILQLIAEGTFSPDHPDRYHGLVHRLWHHDTYFVTDDFVDYYQTQRRIDKAYQHQTQWAKMAAYNMARSGFFSSDRTIRGYMQDIWDVEPLL